MFDSSIVGRNDRLSKELYDFGYGSIEHPIFRRHLRPNLTRIDRHQLKLLELLHFVKAVEER